MSDCKLVVDGVMHSPTGHVRATPREETRAACLIRSFAHISAELVLNLPLLSLHAHQHIVLEVSVVNSSCDEVRLPLLVV